MTQRTFIIMFISLCITLQFQCTRSPVSSGTGGTDFPNTRTVIGTLISSDGTPSAHSEVLLLSSSFNAFTNTSHTKLLEDTTDDNGVYRFSISDTGEYTITAVQIEDRTRAIVYGVHVDTDTVFVDAAVMSKPGTIKVTVPEGSSSDNGYIYVPGTTIAAKVNGDSKYVFLDSVPVGAISSINYGELNDTQVTVIRFDVPVTSEEVTIILEPSLKHAKKICFNTTATGADVAGNVIGFPVLIRLSSDNFDFLQAHKNGSDIRFTKNDGTSLSYEIETWDSVNSKAVLWVKVDTIFGNNDNQCITMYWGASIPLTSEASGSDVFDTAAGFQGVWHFNNTADATVKDATANRFEGTPRGKNIPASIQGLIGSAGAFKGDGYIEMPGTANSVLNFPEHGTYSLSAWVNIDSLVGEYQMIASKGDKQYNLQFKGATKNWQFTEFQDTVGWDETASAASSKTWVNLVGVRSGEKQYLYVNGVCTDSTIYTHPHFPSDTTYAEKQGYRNTTYNFMIGTKVDYNTWFFNGLIDEVRISSYAQSPDWIKLGYMNQRSDDMLVIFKNW
ncbi:MAG: DUF2341 domain-containing protein [Fibrobacter sp.]|nr:DUF2341 domain-containing protein [Fibrobacter sp.]